MKSTLKAMLVMAVAFASTAVVLSAFGFSAAEHIPAWLEAARGQPAWVFAAVVAILAVDSVLAIPTVTTVILAGHLLGPLGGGVAASIGLLAAGSICFWGARVLGATRFAPAATLARIRATVGEVGPAPLLIARASPILPEVLSVMAGAAHMSPRRYYPYYALGNVPFAFVAAWAGSISTLDRPWPALVAAVATPALGGTVMLARRLRRAGHGSSRITLA